MSGEALARYFALSDLPETSYGVAASGMPLDYQAATMLVPRDPQPVPPERPAQRWRPADVTIFVAVVCYGAAMLIMAAALFVRLAL